MTVTVAISQQQRQTQLRPLGLNTALLTYLSTNCTASNPSSYSAENGFKSTFSAL